MDSTFGFPSTSSGGSGSSGTIAAMIATTPTVGQIWTTTDTPRPLEFIGANNLVTGNTTYWMPRGGKQLYYLRSGSLASPIATLNAITAGTFTIPGGNPTFPANLLVAGISRLAIRSHFKRAGATAALTLNYRLGSNGTTADNLVYAPSVAALNPEIIPTLSVGISGATTYTGPMGLVMNTASSAQGTDRTTNFAVASPAIVTVDISGANASDGPFNLVSLEVELLG